MPAPSHACEPCDQASVIHSVPRTLTARLIADAIRTADALATDVLARRSP